MTRKTRPIRYNAALVIRANPGVIAQIHAAALRRDVKPSQWIRDSISLALQLENGGNATECKNANR
jgi:hypothetical protein